MGEAVGGWERRAGALLRGRLPDQESVLSDEGPRAIIIDVANGSMLRETSPLSASPTRPAPANTLAVNSGVACASGSMPHWHKAVGSFKAASKSRGEVLVLYPKMQPNKQVSLICACSLLSARMQDILHAGCIQV